MPSYPLALVRPVLVALFVCLLVPSTGRAGDAPIRGEALYALHCATCHGLGGEGDGSAAPRLARRPRDFTQGVYKLKSSRPEDYLSLDDDIFGAITNGISAGGMPPWGDALSEGERRDLVAYLKSLSPVFDEEPTPSPLDLTGKVPATADSVARGRQAYLDLQCGECHGDTGRGPSRKKLKDDYGAAISPRDLAKPWTYIGPVTPEGLYARLTNGIPLTPMPGFVEHAGKSVAAKVRWDLVNYLAALHAEGVEERRRLWWIVVGALALVACAGAGWMAVRRFGRRGGR
ncbi:MAG: c-type cytochrome [Nitrospinae bacterium]|nr:c-type cytochrome [Nitrospinota bacterium]